MVTASMSSDEEVGCPE